MYKIVSVDKDSICFTKDGDDTHYGYMLSPIIYEYVPGDTVMLDENMVSWYKEDKRRVKHIQSLIGDHFESFESMIDNCENWR